MTQRMHSGTHEGLTLAERFWIKVEKRRPDECWPWLAYNIGKERGRMRVDNKTLKLATHVLWFLNHGEWPKKLVLHTCNNGWCMNPDHHYEGTYYDNAQDRRRAGHYAVSAETRKKISAIGRGSKWSFWKSAKYLRICKAWLDYERGGIYAMKLDDLCAQAEIAFRKFKKKHGDLLCQE